MKRKKNKENLNHLLTEENSENHINWFPGHMNKAVNEIQKRLKLVDIILEIRDARSPLVTGNAKITQAIGGKSRLLLLNKAHLANQEVLKSWEQWFTKRGQNFITIQEFDTKTMNLIIETAKDIIRKKRQLSNPGIKDKKQIRLMVLGLPNTGKSTLINKLASRNALRAANKPGLTRAQQWVKVSSEIEMLDTPGVMPPKIDKFEHGQWLAALHAIPDSVVTSEVPACYLIEYFMKTKNESVKDQYDLEHFDHDLISALNHIAKKRGCLLKGGEYDYERVYDIILGDFRSGRLGEVSLGIPPKN